MYVINPHGSATELEQIGRHMAEFLRNDAQED